MITVYLGILLNTKLCGGIPAGRTNHEIISFYEDAVNSYELTPCFFSLQEINLEKNQVYAFVKKGEAYIKQWLPLPKVIHNRGIFMKKHNKKRIDLLIQKGIQVFNYCNRYRKSTIHTILMKNQSFHPHLPETTKASVSSIKHLMKTYDSLIIKPDIGSIGRGIAKLHKTSTGWRLNYPKDKKSRARGTLTFKGHLPKLLKIKLGQGNYIVQQMLPLATYNNNPFDLRISVQKDQTGKWQITGMVGKVAANGKFITNVAQGGTVYRFEDLMKEFSDLNKKKVRENIEKFSLLIVEHLSSYIPHLADIGLDVGINSKGFPLFIECNFKDLRYSFSKVSMLSEWKATYSNPMAYATHLLKKDL